MLALKYAKAWWCVILGMVLHNLPYGPWEGHTWWGQMLEAAENMAKNHGSHPPPVYGSL